MKVSRGMIIVASFALTALAHAQARPAARTPDTATRAAATTKPRTTPAVLHIENSVRPAKFAGKCPATLHWTAHLTVRNPPIHVEYQWIRSDSAKSPLKEITIRGTEGIIGGESWQLGGDKDHLVAWERLEVVAPNAVRSRSAAVTVACR